MRSMHYTRTYTPKHTNTYTRKILDTRICSFTATVTATTTTATSSLRYMLNEKVIDKGVTLFKEGEPTNKLYFILSGQVDIASNVCPDDDDKEGRRLFNFAFARGPLSFHKNRKKNGTKRRKKNRDKHDANANATGNGKRGTSIEFNHVNGELCM